MTHLQLLFQDIPPLLVEVWSQFFSLPPPPMLREYDIKYQIKPIIFWDYRRKDKILYFSIFKGTLPPPGFWTRGTMLSFCTGPQKLCTYLGLGTYKKLESPPPFQTNCCGLNVSSKFNML
jgi:hypothetical protein